MPFITLNAKSRHTNTARDTRVSIDSIAYFAPAGDQGEPNGPTLVSFTGGTEQITVTQTVAQVASLIDAAE